ncbi:hypothetical protein BAU15_01775 [Enterococcus sp. JM4C]|uniref:LacI family DNA-binding transcriptional regulator n=1 Tax=Candidatus Enterococcus huntleyi TaxID=1857217 RepID=UPI00137B47E8|nr:LacI family DNA-binding transcriptional regulator [Enterococcus sp. JM4C]KAF1299640.1 hypothetical protein BAU15_01775 [Enterococcus sp. JM4C]
MKLEDVARLANVSKSAASLALNNKPGVSVATRENILRIAEQNNYIPLRKHIKSEQEIEVKNDTKIRFVACTNNEVVTKDYEKLPFFNELLSYLSTEISEKKYNFSINKLPKETFLEELKQLEIEEPSDGIILLGTNLTAAQTLPISQTFEKLVVIDTECTGINCNTVTMNNYLGAYDAVNHFIKMGHSKIGYIKGTPRINNFIDRRRGFKDALKKNNIDPKKLPKYYLHGMKIQPVEEKINQFMNFIKSVTAVFCEDDYMAISIIKTLNKKGIKVPEELSIIGFDDISESTVITPELTTIQVPIKQIAHEAICLIEQEINNEIECKKQIFLNTKLILRDSVLKLNKRSTKN